MKKNVLFYAAAALLLLCSCEITAPNKPRGTQTQLTHHLTEVTPADTSRADTYSEYLESRIATAIEDDMPQSETTVLIGGMQADTAVSGAESQMQTAVSSAESRMQTSVSIETTVPVSEQTSSETVTCTAEETSQTFPLDDIPSVPSEVVKPDTALTTN